MYVSVGLTEQARDALRTATLSLTTPAQRRLTMSEVLIMALQVSERHEAEVLQGLSSLPARK